MRVQITKMPLSKAAYGKQVDGALSLQPGAFGGADYKAMDSKAYKGVKNTVDEVPRDEANLEAERGETAFGPITGQTIPDHLKIKGKRHFEGGTPLNLPDDTFIFSDTASLRINDPAVLAMFNKTPKKGGYTPAELAKPYDISKYKSILLDPDSGKLERNTAIIMIKNYIMKLGALALVQESMKGFPQGVPAMAKPYMEANGITEVDLIPELKEQAEALETALAQGQTPGGQQMPQEQNPMMAQEMQQANPEQAMMAQQQMLQQPQEAPSYPEQMPGGAPIASPESMAQMQGTMPPPNMMSEQDMMSPQEGMMRYGGMPYAAYGMQMGGFDFPYYPDQMAYGGVPKFVGGGTGPGDGTGNPSDKQQTRPKNTREVPKSEYDSKNWEVRRDAQGEYKVNKYTGEVIGKAKVFTKEERGPVTTGGPGYTKEDVCRWVSDPKNKHYYGWSGLDAYNAGLIDKTNISFIDQCTAKLEGAGKIEEAIYAKEPGETPCLCLNKDGSVYKDANGNTKEAPKDENGVCQPNDPSCSETPEKEFCRCVDPNTGEVKEFPIEKEEECVCEGGARGEISGGGMDRPHLSKRSRLDIARNALMKTKVPRSNVVLTPRAQIEGAYEEYQTKVDTAQAAVNALQNAVMTGMAGATGAKQAQMKDLLGKGLRASMDAVAKVQGDNTERQRETNVQKATIDNANMLANTQILNQGFAGQKDDRAREIANENKRLFNTIGADIAGIDRMTGIHNLNTTNKQFAADYENEFVYPTGVEKPFTGAGGSSFEDRITYYAGKTGDYDKAFDMAYKEARLNKGMYGGQRMANGGYVLASNIYPFLL